MSKEGQSDKRLPYRIGAILKRIPTPWWTALGGWAVTRVLLGMWGALVWSLGLVPEEPILDFYFGVMPIKGGIEGIFLGLWQRWDAIHYMRIVQAGYADLDLTAFFPLYPILARTASSLFHSNALLGLLLVNDLALVCALVLSYQVVKEIYDPPTAHRTVVVVLVYPMAFFLLAPYPQSLALMLTLLAFRSARRGHWLTCLGAGLALGLTHSTGLPLMLAVGWEVWRSCLRDGFRRHWPRWGAVVGPALGTGGFLAWRSMRGFPPITVVMDHFWGRSVQWPWTTLHSLVDRIREGLFPIVGWANLAIVLLALIVVLWGFQRLPRSLWLYQLSMFSLLLLTPTRLEPFASLGRYSLILFPNYIALARWTRWRAIRLLGFALGLLLYFFFAGQFFMWVWVG